MKPDFENKNVNGASYSSQHTTYGTLVVLQYGQKGRDVEFKIVLRREDMNHKLVVFTHKMFVTNYQKLYRGSTLGYSNIDMPDQMQGIGVGYLYHLAAAICAKAIGVDYLVVDSAGTEAMQKVCKNLEMEEYGGGGNNYRGGPDVVIFNARKMMLAKGWSTV